MTLMTLVTPVTPDDDISVRGTTRDWLQRQMDRTNATFSLEERQAAMDDETTVAEITVTKHIKWVATTRSWTPPDSKTGEAIALIGIRKWSRTSDLGEWTPAKSGLSCAATQVPFLVQCLEALQKHMEKPEDTEYSEEIPF